MGDLGNSFEKCLVYTPCVIAEEITRYVLSKVRSSNNVQILEPSVGKDVFIDAFINLGCKERNITAIDIDGKVVERLKCQYSEITAKKRDFLGKHKEKKKYDIIIGNPPYIRKHNFTSSQKNNIQKLGFEQGYSPSAIKNTWVAFILKSIDLMQEEAVMAFIIPYEFMLVLYGHQLRHFLRQKFFSIEVFIPEKRVFSDIEQDAVLLILSKTGRKGMFVNLVHSLRDISCPKRTKLSSQRDVSTSIERRGFLLDLDTKNLLIDIQKRVNRISDYCSSSPGIVTGANNFFIINAKKLKEYKLEPWARKIIKRGGLLPEGPVF